MAKKPSIREFVSEDSLKFQLLLLKMSNQLKNIENLSEEEIIKKWEYDINKKVNKWEKNIKDLDPIADEQEIEILNKNIKYLVNLDAPTDKAKILSDFEDIRQEYINSLEDRINNNSTGTKSNDKELLEYAKEIELVPNISKEKFGIMLLLIVKNLATMPSFSGYSSNWKTDFFSNAIEKTLLYLDNFDSNLLSVRTGTKSKAFAYVTQICYNAFLNIINDRKKDEALLKDTISFESSNLDGIRNSNLVSDIEYEEEESREYIIKIKASDNINDVIYKGISYIKDSNEILDINDAIKEEIKYLEENTSEDEKDENYKNYIKDLECKVIKILNPQKIQVLKIIKPKGLSISGIDESLLKTDIPVIIENKKKKIKKTKEKEEVIENELTEIEEYANEW